MNFKRFKLLSPKRKKQTKAKLTHFSKEQTYQIEDQLWRCHRVQIVVLNEKNLSPFSTFHRQDCV